MSQLDYLSRVGSPSVIRSQSSAGRWLHRGRRRQLRLIKQPCTTSWKAHSGREGCLRAGPLTTRLPATPSRPADNAAAAAGQAQMLGVVGQAVQGPGGAITAPVARSGVAGARRSCAG